MVNDQAMIVGASFGFAMYPRDAKDVTKLLRLADQRMYWLKKRPVNGSNGNSGGYRFDGAQA